MPDNNGYLDTELPTTVGIELELHEKDVERARTILAKRKLNVRGAAWKGEGERDESNQWVVKTDASAGVEVVSKVMATYRDFEEIETACIALLSSGFTCAEECGFHVHIGVENMTTIARENFTRFLYHFEDAFFDLAPTRRGNKYCKPLKAQIVHDLRHGHGWTAWTSQNERYYWINGKSFERHKTLEFRIMTGSLNYKHIMGWVALLLRVYQIATTSGFPNVNAHERSDKTGKILFNELWSTMGFDATFGARTCAGRGKEWLDMRYKDVTQDKIAKRELRRRRLKEAWSGGAPFEPVFVGSAQFGDYDDPRRGGAVSHHAIQPVEVVHDEPEQ